MDERGRKIIIGVMLAILAGVFLHIFVFGLGITPSASDQGTNTRPEWQGGSSPEASAVSSAMVGVWQSTDDPKFSREFRDNGIVIDRYMGDEVATVGIWGAFTADMAPAGTTTGLAPGIVYVQITFDDAVLYFSIIKAADTLEMLYLDRGSQLNFSRVE